MCECVCCVYKSMHVCVCVCVCVCACTSVVGCVCLHVSVQQIMHLCVWCVCACVYEHVCINYLSVVPNMPSQHLKTLSLNPIIIIPHTSTHACVWQSY